MHGALVFKTIKYWEMAGFLFLVVFGSILHFTYEWSGRDPIVGIFSPVNESVWEHLKMGFSSLMFYSAIEYIFLHKNANNFIIAKSLGLLVMMLLITVVFYAYTAAAGRSILILDILMYIAGCGLCQFIGYKLMTYRKLALMLQYINAGILLLLTILFISFTYYTPKLPVFKDYNKNSYGTEWK